MGLPASCLFSGGILCAKFKALCSKDSKQRDNCYSSSSPCLHHRMHRRMHLLTVQACIPQAALHYRAFAYFHRSKNTSIEYASDFLSGEEKSMQRYLMHLASASQPSSLCTHFPLNVVVNIRKNTVVFSLILLCFYENNC